MKYIKLFDDLKKDFDDYHLNNADQGKQYFGGGSGKASTIKKAMLLVLANSFINNSFLKMKNTQTGELMKVNSMEHEDGSGKTFNIYIAIYDANKKYIKSETRFYRVSD